MTLIENHNREYVQSFADKLLRFLYQKFGWFSSVMHHILSSIKMNDVVSPLRLMLNERAKQRTDFGRTRFHSIYRDVLFLSFAALGRDCIDHGT
jgi:hypothetical protein